MTAVVRPAELGLLLGSWPQGVPRRASFHERVAATAERAGYGLLFVGDHLFAASPNLDSLVWLTHLASVTERISIGTCVLQLALRDPVVTAKQLASIDVLSAGRLIVGVGVGGEFAAEWDAVEVDRSDRGRRTDEHLELVRQLWGEAEVSFRGTYRTVDGVTGSPAPWRVGGPPVWIGGGSDAALRRAARHQGWCGYLVSLPGIRRRLGVLDDLGALDRPGFRVALVAPARVDRDKEAALGATGALMARRYGRDLSDRLDAVGAFGTAEHIGERVAAWRAAGVGDVVLYPQSSPDELVEQVDALADAALGPPAGRREECRVGGRT